MNKLKPEPYINVTPLIDVLLVVLIIWMVITPLKPARFKVRPSERPPQDEQRLAPNPQTLAVEIKQDLSLTLNTQPVGSVNDSTALAALLAKTFEERRPTPQSDGSHRIERTVFIKAPRSLLYGEVAKVIDSVVGSGASPIGLQIDDLP